MIFDHVYFHFRIPNGGLIRQKWLKVIKKQRREDDWMPTQYSTVCSEHFLPEDKYVTKKNWRRLKTTAIPVIKVK